MAWKRDEERSYARSWFLAAASFAVVTAWAVWDNEFTRAPWIEDQLEFFRLERKLAREDLAETRRRYRTTGAARVRALDEEVAALKRKQRAPDVARARAELAALDAEAADVETDLTFAKSDEDEAYYLRMSAELRAALARGDERRAADAEVRRCRATEDEHAARVRRAQARLGRIEAKRRPLRTLLEPLDVALEAAERERATIRRELEDAEQRARVAKSLGLLDVQLQQVVTRWRRDEQGRARDEVDRCASCHRGVDSRNYEDPERVPRELRAHPDRAELLGLHPVERFGCTSCHQGQGRSTEVTTAHAGAAPRLAARGGKTVVSWEREGDAFWEEPLLRPGTLFKTRIDSSCDEIEIALGEGEPKRVRLDHRVYPTWADLQRALEAKLDAVLAGMKEGTPVEGSSVHRVGNRVRLALRLRTGPAADGAEPAELRISWPDDALRRLLGFAGPLAGSDRYLATTAPEPIVPSAGPTSASGLQVPVAHRERLILGAPLVEAACLRCHTGDVDLRPLRSVAEQANRVAERRLEQARRAAASAQSADGTADAPDAAAPPAEPEPAEPDAEDTRDLAPTLAEGRSIYRRLNCSGCHVLDGFAADRASGPPLPAIGGKLEADFLWTWLRDPRAFRRGTRMPTFWPVPIDPETHEPARPGSAERRAWERRRDDEATAITAFVLSVAQSQVPAGYGGVPGASAEQGQRFFETLGCRGCHTTAPEDERPGVFGTRERDLAPNLSRIGRKTNVDWLTWWIEDPARAWPASRMPNLRLTRAEAASVALYLSGLAAGPAIEAAPEALRQASLPAELIARGRTLVSDYGCHGCHEIPGFEKTPPVGTELDGYARKDPATLDFGYAVPDPSQQTWEVFTTWKLDAPHIYRRDRVVLKMPDYDLSAHEIRALLVFLAGTLDDRSLADFDPAQTDRGRAILQGRQLVEDLNCRGCHVIEGRGGDIRAYSSSEPEALALLPPVLRAEGWRVQPEWLYAFLQQPTRIRPWIQVRMPTFPLSAEQTAAVVEYFAALDGQPYPYERTPAAPMNPERWRAADALFTELQCQSCHVLGNVIPEGQDPAQLAPDLAQVPHRLRPSWIQRWLENPEHLMPGTRMPSYWPEPYTTEPSPYAHETGRTPQEEMAALVDYMMHLGSPPPGSPATAEPRR